MGVVVKRRQLAVATLALALGAAVLVNWYFTKDTKKTVAANEETTQADYVQNLGEAKYVNAEGVVADYFAETQLKRQKSRDEALEELNNSLSNAESGSQEAQAISASITAMTGIVKQEADIESLISAKIGSECLAVISDNSAQIVVKKGSLNDDTALQITEIVTANSDIAASNIKITET